MEGEGSLVSFTKVNYGPTALNRMCLILALVDYNGTKVFGRFKKDVPEGDQGGDGGKSSNQ